MKRFSKKITGLLILIIVIMLAAFVIMVEAVGNNDNKNTEANDKEMVLSAPVDATLSDAQPNQVATSIDADSEAVYRAQLERIIETSARITTWENRPKPQLPSHVAIELELIYQHPELPTGCESVALTMLLKYYGFELEKTTIAREYLIYSSNFVEGYQGNPFSANGAGIYSPGLTRTANKYLDAQGSDLNAKNVTDSTPEELYRYLSEGTPVVIWNTVYMIPNQPSGQIVRWGEKEYQWDRSEHCMVLSGYDLERNVVIVHDPIQGIIERDADIFWERYENLGSMAVIIR